MSEKELLKQIKRLSNGKFGKEIVIQNNGEQYEVSYLIPLTNTKDKEET